MEIKFGTQSDPQINRLWEYALQFYAGMLMMDSFRQIVVKYVVLEDMYIGENGMASVLEGPDDMIHGAVFFEGEYDTAKMNEFTLGIWYNLKPGEIFEIMAHEMVHIEQYASHRLRTIQNANGVFNRWDMKMIPTDTPYNELPWEIDAYARQDKLFLALSADPGFMSLCKEVAEAVSH